MPINEYSTVKLENEKKKKYLNGYINAKMEEKRIKAEIKEIRDRQTSAAVNLDGMPHGSGHSDLSSYAAKIDALTRALYIEQEKAVSRYAEIRTRILLVTDEQQREVLIKKYLLRKTLEEIAVEMGYSYKQVCRIHGNALASFRI